jgi:MFS family permease
MSPLLDETTSLLAHPRRLGVLPDSDEEDFSDLEEEPLNVLLTRYGSPAGSLGLSGGMGVFGTPIARRRSIFDYSRTDNTARRPSQPAIHREQVISQSPPQSPLTKPPSKPDDIAESSAESIDAGTIVENPPKFLYGISDSQFWACFTGIVLAYFVACFDSTLMASSHPVITSYFDASNAASWLSTSFLLTSTAFQPMFGRISDTFGRKIPFLFSLIAFLLGTLCCAIAQTIVQFIVARAVCGLGAGGALAMGSIIMSDLVPLETRGSYLAFLNLSYGVGSSLGAALGGFLAETFGWRWEFGIQVPVVLLCVVVAYFTTPSELGPMLSKETSQTFFQTVLGFDLAGSALLTSSVTFLILALNLGGNILPWTHPFIITSILLFFVLGTALIYVEERADKAVMPLHMLFQIPRGNIIFSNFLSCMTMNTILFNIPLFFQAVMLDSPTRSGTRLIVPFLLNMAAAFATGNWISYSLRLRPTLLLGSVLIVFGSVSLASMDRDLPSWLYSWLIGLATGGQGFNFPTLSIAILAVSHADDMAVATSTLILFRSLGTVMGVAVSSLVAQNGLSYYLEHTVTGPGRDSVIRDVRRSVEAVVGLEGTVREQGTFGICQTQSTTLSSKVFHCSKPIEIISGCGIDQC